MSNINVASQLEEEEMKPLLAQEDHASYTTSSSSSSDTCIDFDPVRDSEDTWLHIMQGDFLQCIKPYRQWLKYVFNWVLGNTLIAIILVLLCKFYGWTWYRYMFPHSLPLNDWWFQLANLSLVFSYLLTDLLNLRICLFFACLFFGLFGWFGLANIAADCVLYNFAMSVINLGCISVLIWERRYIRFSPEWEDIYINLFKPIGVSRYDFALFQKKGVIREKVSGTILHHIKDNVTSMCILVSGEVDLYNRSGVVCNTYHAHSVLEGIEWCKFDLEPKGKIFEHRFVARTRVVFAKWSRETLVRMLQKHPQLKQSLRIMLGLNAARTTYGLLNSLHLRDSEEHKSEQ